MRDEDLERIAAARRLVRVLGPPAFLLGAIVEYYFVALHIGCRQGTIDCRPGPPVFFWSQAVIAVGALAAGATAIVASWRPGTAGMVRGARWSAALTLTWVLLVFVVFRVLSGD